MNNLKIKVGALGRIVVTISGGKEITVFIPTTKTFANAKVLTVDDNSFTAHWLTNWNLNGDFSSELMSFDEQAVLDTGDLADRNTFRKENGLIEIS